jgi:hypothetical protein
MLIPLLMQLGMFGSTAPGGVAKASRAKKIEVLDRQSNKDFISSFVRTPFEQEVKPASKQKVMVKAPPEPKPADGIDPIALFLATED